MAGVKSRAAYWNPLMHDARIMAAIKHRMGERGWSLLRLSEEAGITYSRLSRYFNEKPKGITNVQLYYLCDLLGIKIKIETEFI